MIIKRLEIMTSWEKKRKFNHEEFDNKISDSKSDCKTSSREKQNTKKKFKIDSEDERNIEKKSLEYETDSAILQRRQKQVDYGKNTVGYQNYINQVPLTKRTKEHPRTPDKYLKYSRRSWDTLIKIWRRNLHEFDPNIREKNDDDNDDSEE